MGMKERKRSGQTEEERKRWKGRVMGGQKERKRRNRVRKDQIKGRNRSPAVETGSWGGPSGERSRTVAARVAVAEFTYIDLTENNIYYAANHNQGVEHIPGVPKIALSEVERVKDEVREGSAQRQKAFTLAQVNVKHTGTRLLQPRGWWLQCRAWCTPIWR